MRSDQAGEGLESLGLVDRSSCHHIPAVAAPCRSWAPRLELQESHEGRLDLGNVAAGGTGSEVGSRTVAAADTEAGRGIGSAGVAAEVVGAAEEVELVVLTINDC